MDHEDIVKEFVVLSTDTLKKLNNEVSRIHDQSIKFESAIVRLNEEKIILSECTEKIKETIVVHKDLIKDLRVDIRDQRKEFLDWRLSTEESIKLKFETIESNLKTEIESINKNVDTKISSVKSEVNKRSNLLTIIAIGLIMIGLSILKLSHIIEFK